jgi:hypothetical protein
MQMRHACDCIVASHSHSIVAQFHRRCGHAIFVKYKHQDVARRKVSVDNPFRGEVCHDLCDLLHHDHAVCKGEFVAHCLTSICQRPERGELCDKQLVLSVDILAQKSDNPRVSTNL